MNIINLHMCSNSSIDFRYPDDFNYPNTYPDTRGQNGPDNRGSTVQVVPLIFELVIL